MFPLQRHQVNYESVQIGDLLTHYELPPFQRVKNEQHMNQLYEKVKLYYEKYNDIMFPGTISFGTYEDNLDKWMVFDGQHRLQVLQKLRQLYPDIDSIFIRVDHYHVRDEKEMWELYHIINQNEPVQLYTSLHVSSVASVVEKWFITRYGSYWKKSERPTLLNVNGKEVLQRMESMGYFANPSHVVIHALERLCAFYKEQTRATWESWGISWDDKLQQLLTKDSFYLGLYRTYEWIPRLFSDATTIDHSTTKRYNKCNKIPKKVRIDVWNKRFKGAEQGTCYCCHEAISCMSGFHCGHIVSVHDGGKNEVENLEVVCVTCNLEMGTMNMNQYKTFFTSKNK